MSTICFFLSKLLHFPVICNTIFTLSSTFLHLHLMKNSPRLHFIEIFIPNHRKVSQKLKIKGAAQRLCRIFYSVTFNCSAIFSSNAVVKDYTHISINQNYFMQLAEYRPHARCYSALAQLFYSITKIGVKISSTKFFQAWQFEGSRGISTFWEWRSWEIVWRSAGNWPWKFRCRLLCTK